MGRRADRHRRQIFRRGTAGRNTSAQRDDFLRGHFQFQILLAKDFTIAGDLFHDFEATGGFRQNIGVEVRLAKFFFPRRARIRKDGAPGRSEEMSIDLG